jgi:pimeloyl-ACP methyl ester carboxylesterase
MTAPQKVIFTAPHGTIQAVYHDAGKNTPLILFAVGLNGFYNFSLWPYMRQQLQQAGISSLAFNYSHGGVVGDSDFFDDLEGYEKNTVALRVMDTEFIIDQLETDLFSHHKKPILFGHNLGGAVISFVAENPAYQDKIDGLIYLATTKTIDFLSDDIMQQWKKDRIYYRENGRTKQKLPQGEAFLLEILDCEQGFNVERAVTHVVKPVLMLHGNKDEVVPYQASLDLFACIQIPHPANKLKVIEGGDHILNAPHPFQGTTPQIESALQEITDWMKRL